MLHVAGALETAFLVHFMCSWKIPRSPCWGSSHVSGMAARPCLCCLCSHPACPLPVPCLLGLCPTAGVLGTAALVSSSVVPGGWQVLGPPARCHAATTTPTGCSLCPACSSCPAASVAAVCPAAWQWALLAGSAPLGPQQLPNAAAREDCAWLLPSSVHPCCTGARGDLFRRSAWGFAQRLMPVHVRDASEVKHHGWMMPSAGSEEGRAGPRSKGGCSALKISLAAGSEWAGGRGKQA